MIYWGMIVAIIFLFIQLGFVIFLFYMCVAFLTGAPFVPSRNPAAASMIRMADIKKGERVLDLGSGNGKLLLLAKKRGAVATGYEINPMLVLWSNIRGAHTVWKNFWKADVSQADVIFVYLLPSHMTRLAQKLKRELAPGTRIVSNSFIFPGWKILRQDAANHIYVFRV